MSFKWQTFNRNSKHFEFLLTMSFYWHKGSFSWSAFILMTLLYVHGHHYWRCADKWSFIMTVYTRRNIDKTTFGCYSIISSHATDQWVFTRGVTGINMVSIPLGIPLGIDGIRSHFLKYRYFQYPTLINDKKKTNWRKRIPISPNWTNFQNYFFLDLWNYIRKDCS